MNPAALQMLADQAKNTMFGLYDMFSGKNLSQMTIFALGIMPYISASIILQLLTVVWPYLERLSKEGELGPPQDHAVHALRDDLPERRAVAGDLDLPGAPDEHRRRSAARVSHRLGFRLMTVLTLTTGTGFIMWLGEQITERGIGNGMSLIIYAGIVVNFPGAVLTTIDQLRTGQISLFRLLLLMVLMVLVVAAIVFVERGHRRVTVQYAKRVVGRRMYGGSSTHIPLKVNTGGVIPVIFASSILAFPITMRGMAPDGSWLRSARSIRSATGCRCTTCCISSGSSSSATSTRPSSSIPMTSPRTCGSTAGSSRASAPASGRRSTSTRS